MSEQGAPVAVGTIHISMVPEASEIWAELQRVPGLEMRINVLKDRCNRLLRATSVLQSSAITTPSGVDAQISIDHWQEFVHDVGVIWRELEGERVAEENGIFLDG